MTQRLDVSPVPGSDVQIGLLLAMLDDATNDWRHLMPSSTRLFLWATAQSCSYAEASSSVLHPRRHAVDG